MFIAIVALIIVPIGWPAIASLAIDILGPGAFLSMIVALGLFFALQRYFVEGALAGPVK